MHPQQPVVARLLAQVAALRAELSRTQHELRLWQVQLDLAQKEILRAQQVVDEVDRARADAEERSHRYRRSLRRLLDERAAQLAKEEGYREGFQSAAALVPPEPLRPHTNPGRPQTLPERIADEWRSQNRDVETQPAVEPPSIPPVSPSNNTERTVVNSGLLSRPASSSSRKQQDPGLPSPHDPSQSYHRPASRKQHDPNQSYQLHNPSFSSHDPSPSPHHPSFSSHDPNHSPRQLYHRLASEDPNLFHRPASSSSSRKQHDHPPHVYHPPALAPLSPIPVLSNLAAIPENTPSSARSSTTSYPISLPSSVPVTSADSR